MSNFDILEEEVTHVFKEIILSQMLEGIVPSKPPFRSAGKRSACPRAGIAPGRRPAAGPGASRCGIAPGA